jgi:LuxR family maltose regulon positive regulatory protein
MSERERAITPASFASFGALLRYLRQRALLSRAELARAAGYSESQIARLELDQRRPDVTAVQARFVPALGLDAEPGWVERLIALAKPPAGARPSRPPPTSPPAADREMAAQPPVAGALASDLLATKLFVPRPRPNAVPRPRLLSQLDRALTVPLTLVAAPAGSGKTTLLADWLASRSYELRVKSSELDGADDTQNSKLKTQNLQVAWLSLDDGDNDPTIFLRYLIAAFQRLAPALGSTALALVQTSEPPAPETLLRVLLNDLAAFEQESLLALDDYHRITTPAIHQALAFLLEHLPPPLHLILASREDPPLPLARLRGRGQLFELRARDLRFSVEESAVLLRDSMGVAATDEMVTSLTARTEGWAAGLQLAALALHDRADGANVVAALSGSQRYVGDYLAGEVLDHLPAHLKTFVLQTSILERMCGELCDAVLGLAEDEGRKTKNERAEPFVLRPSPALSRGEGSFGGDSYSQLILAELERRQLFLVPLDDERRWYRYHHLFADLLGARLRQGVNADAVAALHCRASTWYEAQGLVIEAVHHALAAHDWERAARLLEQHSLHAVMGGQIHTVLGWFNMLPDVVLRARARLCNTHAILLLLTNQPEAAEARMGDFEACIQRGIPSDQAATVRGRGALVRANIVRQRGDLVSCVAFAQQALDLLPETEEEQITRPVAMLNAARAFLITGDVRETSERVAVEALVSTNASGHMLGILGAISNLARLRVLQGRLRAAILTFQKAEQIVPEPEALRSLEGSPAYYFGMGDLLYEWNDLDAAEEQLTQGIELVGGPLAVEAEYATQGYLALARLQQAQGKHIAAIATLEAFVDLAQRRRFVAHLMQRGIAAQAALRLRQGQRAAAIAWAEASDLHADDDLSFPREAEYLTWTRVRIAQGWSLPTAPYLDDALRLLERLLAAAEVGARMHSAIEILIVRALAYDALDDRARALSTLEQALALAEPEGYVRIFVDEGAPMASLLQAGRAQGIAPNYNSKLLAAFPAQDKHTSRLAHKHTMITFDPSASPSPHLPVSASPGPVEPLSARELEVLRLIAEGRSNQQLARDLIIAVGTVKRHVNSIFGKLGVQNRLQAVIRARELGILAP